MQAVTPRNPVVVAVDGSAESESALRWAVDHARTVGLGLKIVTCYQQWENFESTKEDARRRAQGVIRSVPGAGAAEHALFLASIEDVLADHSHDASLIVIGTRSATRLRQALAGSATNRITGKAICPVVSIPLESLDELEVADPLVIPEMEGVAA